MLEQVQPGQLEAAKHEAGPRRAVLQCHHGNSRYTVGEVWGQAVFGIHGPHDLLRTSYPVPVKCRVCPGDTGLRVLDLAALREALRQEHTGLQKIDVAGVSHAFESPER